MNSYLVKAICHQLAKDLGGHKVVAALAEISEPVWSGWCNFDKPDSTLPLHRAMLIEEKTGRRDFTRAMSERLDAVNEAAGADPRVLSARALEAIARAEIQMAAAYADGEVSEAEKRDILAEANRLVDRAHAFAAAAAALETGAVRPALKAV